nr:type I toxin-antitoxin system Fst family toxin [Catellicoccus marimammalium]
MLLYDTFKFIICPIVVGVILQLFSEWLKQKKK